MALRGKQILYTSIIPNKVDKPRTLQENKALRNDVLAARYYYHAHLCRNRYDDCLNSLSFEFHISPDTIVKRLSTRTGLLKDMVSSDTTPKDLQRIYPHFNWSVMRIG